MTNQQKYPDAKVGYNPNVSDKCKGVYYVRLSNLVYLLYDGSVGLHDSNNTDNTYYKTREQAEKALDLFMNNEKLITLSEIKNQFENAKKLIGKIVDKTVGRITQVELLVDSCTTSYLCEQFFKKHGYVIKLIGEGASIPYTPELKSIEIMIKNYDGIEYKAENDGKCWKFGDIRISKTLIRKAYQLMNSKFADGNSQIRKITISAFDFDLDTLKQLVEYNV